MLSREAVNRVTRAAQAPMQAWHQEPIRATPPVLIVDGVWVQVLVPTGETWTDKRGHTRQQVRGVERVVLTVMGLWPDGQRQIVGYQAAEAEDSASWTQLFAALIGRGLAPEQVQLVVSDSGTGLPPAIATCFPNAQPQRCVVHTVQGLERAFVYKELERSGPEGSQLTAEEARRRRRQQLSDAAHAMFEAPTRTEAVALWQRSMFISDYHRHLQMGDAFNRTPAGQLLLGCRWQVEPAVAWLVRYQGCRRARRVGQAAAQCQLYQACAVRNLLLWVTRVQRKEAPRPGA